MMEGDGAKRAAAPGLRLPRGQKEISNGRIGALILVNWQIKPECDAEFLEYWRVAALVRDRTGLIGEFLCKVVPGEPLLLPWITWEWAAEPAEGAVQYVNVGMWSGTKAFLKQIASDFGDNIPPSWFELRRRRRLLLAPQAWRIGAAAAPACDSVGVL